MTLEKAIKYYEEEAKEKNYEYQDCIEVHDMENAIACGECAEEYRQLAEWLGELKAVHDEIDDADDEDEIFIGYLRKKMRDVPDTNVGKILNKKLSETQKPLDTISRQAAIDAINNHLRRTDVPASYSGIVSALTEWLNGLPSVQPDSKESSLTQKALDNNEGSWQFR